MRSRTLAPGTRLHEAKKEEEEEEEAIFERELEEGDDLRLPSGLSR